MKKYYNNISILTTLLIFLCSCEKESYVYDGTYYATSFQVKKERLFTKSGEIYSQIFIDNYIKNNNIDFLISQDSIINVDGNIKVEFSHESKAQVTMNEKLETRDSYRKGMYFYLESEDTSYRVNYEYSYIQENIMLNFPLYIKHDSAPFPNGGFWPVLTTFKHCYYLKTNENTLEYPMLSYRINISDEYSESNFYANNEFNRDVLSYLKMNDTLIIQETKIVLEKE